MDELPPPRGGVCDLFLPDGLHLASSLDLAAAQTPQGDGARPATALSPRMASRAGRGPTVLSRHRSHRALPLPGNSHSLAMGDEGISGIADCMVTWRAGCGANSHV